MYQTVHRQLTTAHRLTVDSYGFCIVLLMCWMWRHIPDEERPSQRHSQRSGIAHWFMNEEGMRKSLVTMLVLIHAIPR
jgi:predicted MFS family arabinose efflux permease